MNIRRGGRRQGNLLEKFWASFTLEGGVHLLFFLKFSVVVLFYSFFKKKVVL